MILFLNVLYWKYYTVTCNFTCGNALIFIENCNAGILRFGVILKYIKSNIMYKFTKVAFVSRARSKVKDGDTTLISHGFEIRLETGRKIERGERWRREGRKREPPRSRSGGLLFRSLRLECERENALLREIFNGNFSKLEKQQENYTVQEKTLFVIVGKTSMSLSLPSIVFVS